MEYGSESGGVWNIANNGLEGLGKMSPPFWNSCQGSAIELLFTYLNPVVMLVLRVGRFW